MSIADQLEEDDKARSKRTDLLDLAKQVWVA